MQNTACMKLKVAVFGTIVAAACMSATCAPNRVEERSRIEAKRRQIEQVLPRWIAAGGKSDEIEPLMRRAADYIRSGAPLEAEREFDKILALVNSAHAAAQDGERSGTSKSPEQGTPDARQTPRVPPESSRLRASRQGPLYLVFQLTTFIANGEGKTQPFDKQGVKRDIDAIIAAAGGEQGDGRRTQLGFAVGPLTMDHTDAQLRETIRGSFDAALEKGVAVVLHIDDSMFWRRRRDLWGKTQNIEWRDWKRTPNRGRKLDWGGSMKLAPQMCFNSEEIKSEVRRLARDVIGLETRREIEKLERLGKRNLFGGVIAGWETQIGKDFDTDQSLGYCALTNRGFTAEQPPKDINREREKVVQEFISLWTSELHKAGIDKTKIFSHTAFFPQKTYEELKLGDARFKESTYSNVVNFAPPWVAFAETHCPGFSTYPAPGLFEQIYEELGKNGSPPWASSEGTNLVIGGMPGQSGMSMAGYLAKMFNHGAVLVNIFAWGVGGEAGKRNPFRSATEGKDAVTAYRTFLRAETLIEEKETRILSPDRLAAKIHRIQKELPQWMKRSRDNPPRAQPLLERLDRFVKEQNISEADRVADEILALLERDK